MKEKALTTTTSSSTAQKKGGGSVVKWIGQYVRDGDIDLGPSSAPGPAHKGLRFQAES